MGGGRDTVMWGRVSVSQGRGGPGRQREERGRGGAPAAVGVPRVSQTRREREWGPAVGQKEGRGASVN